MSYPIYAILSFERQGAIMVNYPYHEYRGHDPNKVGSFIRCKSNPCTIHGGSDIMASSPEEAYEKAHGNDVVHGLDGDERQYRDATDDEMSVFEGSEFTSGSKQWYEACKNDFLADDSDGGNLRETYDEMLLSSHDYEHTSMPYLTVYLDNGGTANLPYGDNTQLTEIEAKQLAVYSASEDPSSRIYNIGDRKLAHLVLDSTSLDSAYHDVIDDGIVEENVYDDDETVQKHIRDDEDYSPYDRMEDLYND